MSATPTARPISRSEAAAVLRHYNVGRLMFLRGGGGTANAAVIAVTARGEVFLKRRNPRYASRGQLVYDHAVMRHLARAGLPVTPAMRSLSGSRWLELGGSVYEVFPLVTGSEHKEGDPEQLAAAGRVLGQWHTATADLQPPGNKPLTRLHDPRNSLRGLRWAREQVRATGGDMSAERRLQDLIAVAEHLLARFPDDVYWSLPQCVVHGDYHPANLKFEGSEVAGVFDFDWVGRQPRLVDVADALIYFCGVRVRPVDPGDIRTLTQAFRLDRGRVTAVGAGYGAHIRLTAPELRALPDFIRARWLFSRVDPMERKIPDDERIAYLLEAIEEPLAEIDAAAQWLVEGSWLGANTVPLGG